MKLKQFYFNLSKAVLLILLFASFKSVSPTDTHSKNKRATKLHKINSNNLETCSFDCPSWVAPTVSAFSIQPSCTDGTPNNNDYLQISELTDGDRYHFSIDNTFDDNSGADTYTNATNTFSTIFDCPSGTTPTVTAYALSPSCPDGKTPLADGYLQLSAVEDGNRYHWSEGSNFGNNAGAKDYTNATDISSATFPLQFATGQANPTGSQDYTIRVYNGAGDCFTDVVVTMNEQDCMLGCDCDEVIYLNEVTGGGAIHKYVANVDGTLTEIATPWLDNTALGEDFTNPHGLGTDLNGFLYINTKGKGDIRRVNCEGIPVPGFAIDIDSYNIDSYNNILYTNRQDGYIQSYDLCTGLEECKIYLDGLTTFQNWGLDIVDNYLYATSNIGRSSQLSVQAEPNYLWKIDLDQNSCADIANPIAPFLSSTGTFGIGNSVLGQTSIYGVTADANGDIYVVETDRREEEPTVPQFASRILKYDSNGVLLAISDWDIEDGMNPYPGFAEPNRGYFNARGIVHSEISNRLYVSTSSPIDDCIAMFDVDLTYLGAAVPWTGTAVDNAKAIAITTQCCPTNNNLTIDTTLCGATINEVFFLQELINCGGVICEGLWAEGSNTGLTYDPCDNSVTIAALDACGNFTLASDGTSANSQCGAFTITVNISTVDNPTVSISGDQSHTCPLGAFSALTASTTADSIQWQISTTSCSAGFTDLAGEITSTYTPSGLTDTTFFLSLIHI